MASVVCGLIKLRDFILAIQARRGMGLKNEEQVCCDNGGRAW